MDGRRHLERRETLGYWPAEQEGTGESVGLVTDLSNEGVQIHSKHRFVKGQKLTLRIVVDPKLGGTDHITLTVENAWCRTSGVPDLFHAGFKIVSISEAAREHLHRLLEAFSYPAPGEDRRAAPRT